MTTNYKQRYLTLGTISIYLTFERLFLGVNPFVYFQLAGREEQFGAKGAHVELLPFMAHHMIIKGAR